MKVEGIILAAGLSTRAGTNKLILDINGKAAIERCIYGMYDLCSKIIVVGGYRVEDIKDILDRYSKVELIYNPNYLEGMFSSVKKGLIHIKEERFFLIPGDYPVINKKTYEDMLKLDKDIVIPMYNGKKGHPVLMKSYLIEELLKDISCKTLRDFIDKKGFAPINVQDPAILMDIDTMADYKRAVLYFQESAKSEK
ncbi:nucleotidyltransferase family protein [Clostridium tetani]|uniref:Nucleotidyltransferase family protein n=1 Tax=Clostridium tetani TaxID=1513 RepID=A0ABY0EVG9_CLOTA|nr:nucleotidyltransferase family protein [Clostridium tetani]CDI50677.1 molybdopterin-guanine dinucleotide biosynthesisprotein A [Clostridium tetani 12124569]KHO32199.1 molybdopterin-guanine dinucleotide biosynthesis protein A [Clostridium tetani]RXI39718.1 nucleotidyltransferase family protein [Clostridium tetani]RXI57805.1 nucleotidyltransferase family protein [Clostridium tetani]RXI67733.1 nucleotidyltransferase family protein [Clostridium tetani]